MVGGCVDIGIFLANISVNIGFYGRACNTLWVMRRALCKKNSRGMHMKDLFSEEWMSSFQAVWNAEPGLADELSKIGFNSTIAYGFIGDEKPKGVIVIENGHAVSAGAYAGEEMNWDLRASQGDWEKWMKKPPGMMGLGMVYTTRKLQFVVGDYSAMVKDPRMAGPFVKSFAAMGKA
jgi:hypothetical protein